MAPNRTKTDSVILNSRRVNAINNPFAASQSVQALLANAKARQQLRLDRFITACRNASRGAN